jgi:hypothetical protein
VPRVPLPPGDTTSGTGRIVLHGTDGPMQITASADHSFVPPGGGVPATRTGELCRTTPCVVDLPVGQYELYLSSADGSFKHGDTDTLRVTEGLTYYVRAPGKYEPPRWFAALPIVLSIAASAALVTGSVLAADPGDSGTRTTGYVILGGGFALGVWAGIEIYDASRAKQQEGATTVWKQ